MKSTSPIMHKMCFYGFALLTFHSVISAQPLFRIPKPSCQNADLTIDVLAPEGFQSYHWDFGNGKTATTRVPPPQRYDTPGEKTVKLTVTAATAFRIIESITVIQHNSSWNDPGLFCFDEPGPDMYLEFLSKATFSTYWIRTIKKGNAVLPAEYLTDGILIQKEFPITVWDEDDGLWCGLSDYLGGITYPANSTGGDFSNPSEGLILRIKTKLTTSATYSQIFTVSETPAPVITCRNDSLLSNYNTIGINNQWLNAQQQNIAGATASAYKPTVTGVYYLKTSIGVCSSISTPIQYQPGGCTVGTEEPIVQLLKIVPNPASNRLFVLLPGFLQGGLAHCRIFNLQGMLMANAEYPARQGGQGLEFDVQNWPSGGYTIQVATSSGVSTGRFFVARK